MPLHSDRGYVVITDLADGTKNVDIYTRSGATGPSHLLASYGRLRDVVVETGVPFRAWAGRRLTDDVVEVSYNHEQGRLYVRDPVDLKTSLAG